jgi:PKD repeat protein
MIRLRKARAHPWRRRALGLAVLVTLALGTGSAAASTTTLSSPTTLSGNSTLASSQLFNESGSGVTATGDASITMHWTQNASLGTEFDPNLVRQGRSLDPTDSYTRSSPGSMSIDYSVHVAVSWDGIGPLNFSPTFTTSGTCDLKADGGNYVCHLSSSQISLLDSCAIYPLPCAGPYVKLGLVSDVTITPEGLATLRQATFGGNPDGTNNLTLVESPITDPLAISCSVGAGDELVYSLGSLSATPGVSVDTSLQFDVGAVASPGFPVPVGSVTFATPSILLGTTTGDISMTGAGATFDLGAVQANNIPPTVDAGGPYAGNEGSPITFDGSGSSSICGFPTLRWDYSDGGVAFGKSPKHTFTDDGTYSGLLTATDATGLSSTTTFSVDVSNVAPAVNAGPDTSSRWGRLVAFNGQATDPGSGDQSTLQYTWSFGDGTPSASGGPNVLHAYAAPSPLAGYVATLTVCDKNGACTSDTRNVIVDKRGTTTSYTGPLSSLPSKNVTFSASLTDEFGEPVQGRSVHFTVGAQSADASTNASGVATVTIKLNQKKGSYSLGVSFAGDAKYVASSTSGTFTIG